MEAIEIRNLSKQYGKQTAVNNLNLTIPSGELFALLGLNGAGKTTVIKMLSCLTQPSAGDAYLLGSSIRTQSSAAKAIIGVSPQETAIATNLTVRENLEFMCGIHGFSRDKQRCKIAELTQTFSLEEVLSRNAGKLSGGWQRRLSIAMALISEPKILFLDEPTLGLDVLARNDLWQVIRNLKGHMTIILTTHYMEEAEALCDRIGIMKNGNLQALGTVAALMQQTGTNTFADAFLSIVKEDTV